MHMLLVVVITLVLTVNNNSRNINYDINLQYEQESKEVLLETAKNGDSMAQNELGIRLSEGIGFKSDNKEAVKWFKQSANQGDVFGACNLALHYGRGEGVPKNLILALKWSFISHSLDSLKCHPDDFISALKPTKKQIKMGRQLAVKWLKEHPELKNDFGERPWFGEGDYPLTYRQ